MKGGHPEDMGLSPSGSVVHTAAHAHEVELDLTRVELGISRTFDETWDAVLRVPYMSKAQTAEVLFEEGTSEFDKQAAIRSGQSHHRTQTYEGISDLEFGVGWRKRDILLDGAVFRFSLGMALPTGAYESVDPLRAGDEGREHLHIQFGNGTFDPLLDVYFGVPLSEKWAFSLYGKGRFPLYENDADFLGSVEGMAIPRVTYLATKTVSVSAGLSASYYGYSEWNGVRDPNSGQFTANAALSVGWKVNEHLTTSVSALLPVYDKTFSGEDSLESAPTFTISAAWTF